MNGIKAGRRTLPAPLIAGALAVGLIAPGAASAAGPAQVSPKAGAVLALGSRPTFKVRDGSSAARKFRVYITISTSKKRKRNGDLKRTKIGTFSSMKRSGSIHRYKAEEYTFPTWYMARPGKYYWQAFRIDCSVRRSCHVTSKIRSFRVQ